MFSILIAVGFFISLVSSASSKLNPVRKILLLRLSVLPSTHLRTTRYLNRRIVNQDI